MREDMKKTVKYLAVLMAAAAVSCAKPADEYLHTDCEIHAEDMWITPADDDVRRVYCEEPDEDGVILFSIPRTMSPYFPNLDSLKVRALVGYDEFISPSLSGIKDLTEDFPITVTATQTGESKDYILRVERSIR